MLLSSPFLLADRNTTVHNLSDAQFILFHRLRIGRSMRSSVAGKMCLQHIREF